MNVYRHVYVCLYGFECKIDVNEKQKTLTRTCVPVTNTHATSKVRTKTMQHNHKTIGRKAKHLPTQGRPNEQFTSPSVTIFTRIELPANPGQQPVSVG
jgi:hypothetical protein